MNKLDPTMAEQVAHAVSVFQAQRTGYTPKAVTVGLSDDTLVVTLHEALSAAEKDLSRTPEGAVQVQEYLGQLKDSQWRGVKRAAEGKKKTPYQQLQLFDHNAKLEPEWGEVDTANVRVENQLDFGGPWLATELMRTLHLDKLFESVMPRGGEDISWAKMASVLATCRLCNPSSELFITEHYYRSTAMASR